MAKTKRRKRPATHERRLDAEDLLHDVEVAERALLELARQADGFGARSLHGRITFYYADLKKTRLKLEARITPTDRR